MARLNKGDYVKNFKREMIEDKNATTYLYQIVDVVKHSETLEDMVLYKALYEPYGLWVRPYDMFMEEVDRAKYPEVKAKYRFELMSNMEIDIVKQHQE